MTRIFTIIISYLMPVIIGILVAMATGIFNQTIRFISMGWQSNQLAFILDVNTAWVRALAPIIGAPFLIYILYKIPDKRQHSQTDIIESIHINQERFSLKSSFYSVIGALVSLGSGYSVGQYGPTVQFGASLGYLSNKFAVFKDHYMHVCIGAGVAAAITAIFHAPIAAVVFTHEVIFRFFSVRAVAPITISAVTSYIFASEVFHISTFLGNDNTYIATPATHISVAISAVLAGIIGTIFIKSTITAQVVLARRKTSIVKKISLAAILMALTAYYIPEVMGISSYFLHSVINNYQITLTLLLIVFIAKLLITICTVGLGVPGGVFSPALFLGAVLGAIISELSTLYLPIEFHDSGLLIITTMSAMAGAIMGAPISMILICLEITGNFGVTSAVMLGVVLSNILAYRILGVNSYFDAQLKARGINMSIGRDMLYLERRRIMPLVDTEFPYINGDTALKEVEIQLLERRQTTTYLVDDEGRYIGRLTLLEVRAQLRQAANANKLASEFATQDGQCLYRLSSIWEAVELMGQFDGTHIPVLESPENPKLLGALYESRLIKAYLSDIQQLRRREQHN